MTLLASWTLRLGILWPSGINNMLYSIAMADGSVVIMHLVKGLPEDAIAKWPEEQRAAVVSVREIAAGEIPPDRASRAAALKD